MISKKILINLIFLLLINYLSLNAQTIFTKADSLRGSNNLERKWWDVQRYDIEIEPSIEKKSVIGKSIITYKVLESNKGKRLQIDLKSPLAIDSILLLGKPLKFDREFDVYYVSVPNQQRNSIHEISIFYGGKTIEAINPPWQGGWIFKKDALGRPWVTVTSHGDAGTSIWFPSKDYQGDEPDKGTRIKLIVPDSLVGVSNGRLISTATINDKKVFTWEVKNSINPHLIVPYIGKYENFTGNFEGIKGNLDLSFWVLDYNLVKAKNHFPGQVFAMLDAFEYWMGPYPFYEDSYKLIDAPYPGMEHQSAIAYGNDYQNGFAGRDISGGGPSTKWDFIIVHESAHEWFGNSISTKDIADMWIHEGFASYAETMYVDYTYGNEMGNEYNFGTRSNILNDKNIISTYNVNSQGSSDMYAKASNMLHSIRNSINNDEKFRKIMRGLNSTFHKKMTTTQEVEEYISTISGFDYQYVFDQYLRNTDIPVFEYSIDKIKGTIRYRYTNSIPLFDLPLVFTSKNAIVKIQPTTTWKTSKFNENERSLFVSKAIEKKYYIHASEIK